MSLRWKQVTINQRDRQVARSEWILHAALSTEIEYWNGSFLEIVCGFYLLKNLNRFFFTAIGFWLTHFDAIHTEVSIEDDQFSISSEREPSFEGVNA